MMTYFVAGFAWLMGSPLAAALTLAISLLAISYAALGPLLRVFGNEKLDLMIVSWWRNLGR